jgi:hypothetical protein
VDEHGTLVAVRFRDKSLIKGWTEDFRPNRDFFHVLETGAGTPTRVPIENLKAVFFLKSLGRDPGCVDRRAYGERAGSALRRLEEGEAASRAFQVSASPAWITEGVVDPVLLDSLQ